MAPPARRPQTVHRRKDGHLLAVEVSAAPVEIDSRRFIVAAVRDVSSRRWMESALRNVASETDKFFEVALEMLCVTDQRGVFRRVNQSWERVLGFTPDELMAKPLFDLVHLDDRNATLDAFKQLAQQGGVVKFANRFRRKSGGHTWLQWRCVPDGDKIYAAVRDVAGKPQTGDAADAAPAASVPAGQATGSATPVEEPAPAAHVSAVRVLVVEDNRLNQRVARQMLEHLGIAVETAGDGREAIEAMRRGPDRFDAILMDMQMPEMDGLQATRVIRKEFPKHAVPIIAATASVDGTDMNACLDAGMNDYVPKPIEPRQLERVLSRWIKLSGTATAAGTPGGAGELPDDPEQAGVTAPIGGTTPLKGVDVNAALVRLNGQHDLLVRLLRVFAQEHGTTTAEIAAAIGKEDYEGALRIVHNLKGVAGTLSATAVFEAARALETGLRQGQRASLPGLVQGLGAALDVVCQAVSEWSGATRVARPDEARHEPDRALAGALLTEMDTLLKNRRFSARPRFEQLKEQSDVAGTRAPDRPGAEVPRQARLPAGARPAAVDSLGARRLISPAVAESEAHHAADPTHHPARRRRRRQPRGPERGARRRLRTDLRDQRTRVDRPRARAVARPDPARRDDVGHERLPSLQQAERRRPHARDPGHLRDVDGPRRGRGRRSTPARSTTWPSRSARASSRRAYTTTWI